MRGNRPTPVTWCRIGSRTFRAEAIGRATPSATPTARRTPSTPATSLAWCRTFARIASPWRATASTAFTTANSKGGRPMSRIRSRPSSRSCRARTSSTRPIWACGSCWWPTTIGSSSPTPTPTPTPRRAAAGEAPIAPATCSRRTSPRSTPSSATATSTSGMSSPASSAASPICGRSAAPTPRPAAYRAFPVAATSTRYRPSSSSTSWATSSARTTRSTARGDGAPATSTSRPPGRPGRAPRPWPTPAGVPSVTPHPPTTSSSTPTRSSTTAAVRRCRPISRATGAAAPSSRPAATTCRN